MIWVGGKLKLNYKPEINVLLTFSNANKTCTYTLANYSIEALKLIL